MLRLMLRLISGLSAGAALLLGLAPIALLAQTTAPQPAEPMAKAMVGSWGVDLSARDLAVKPGDDFERYASGKWLDSATIAADRPGTDSFSDLAEKVQGEIHALIETAPADSQIGGLYRSFLDEDRVEKLGLAPLKAELARLDAVHGKRNFARAMGESYHGFGSALIDYSIGPDTTNPELNVLTLSQGGLGLPSRDYYLSDAFKIQREAYRAYIERTLTAIGQPRPTKAAAAILAFETALARRHWTPEETRDIARTNNHYSTASLVAYAPGVDWRALFTAAGIKPQASMLVGPNTAIRAEAVLYARTPLATLKLWEAFHIADQAAPYLPRAMVDSKFAFVRTLSGVSTIRPRWKRGVGLVSGDLGELVGQAYVARYFPPQAKARMEALVTNLKSAMAGRISAASWMSPSTRTAALAKLAAMQVMVGYPDKWRDYNGLRIDPGDLYGNAERAARFNAGYELSFLGQPVDHKKWDMTPQTVNAYNGLNENKIVFPAGILQPPFFDVNADDAANYGAIGMVIGHEISHGFDDQGRKIDATGHLSDWWTAEDAKHFEARAKLFGEQYAKFEPLPGVFLKPELTMGENIADFAGIQVAYDAYHAALGGKPAPVLDGLTGDQRFFLADAQVWRAKQRADAIRQRVATNAHSPSRFRILGPLRNVDAWYQAFNVQPGDTLYLPPEARAHIW